MMKHSPGPWQMVLQSVPVPGDPSRGRRCVALVLSAGGNHTIADCTWGHEEAQANARLIATAPELLELALAYEAWEADVILNGNWSGETVTLSFPQLKQMLVLQQARNAAVDKAVERPKP